VQAADRRALTILSDDGVLSQGTEQNGMLDIYQRNTALIEGSSQFLIGSRKATLDAAPLEEEALHLLHIASQVMAGRGIALALIRPEAIFDVEDIFCL